MFDNDNNFSLISLSILITCLLDNVWILKGECIITSNGSNLRALNLGIGIGFAPRNYIKKSLFNVFLNV